MSKLTRRSFLEHTLAVSAAGLAAAQRSFGAQAQQDTAQSAGRTSANERIGMAVIGFNGRGRSHIDAWLADDRTNLVALCDIDQHTFGPALRMIASKGHPKPKEYKDIRQLLEDKSVDAVSIATPNHWHALAGVWAMQAGKDVYVEKPVSHEVTEGRRLEQARAKYNRICQGGTQSRSSPAHATAIKFIHEGGIGKVILSRGLCYKRRDSIGHFEDSPVPEGVDYNLWLGPAPERPFNKNRFHYNWHWNWAYGNGDIGNQGIHQMDVARWAIKQGLPNNVIGLGGRFGYKDDGQTPNTMVALFEYPDTHLMFEVRGLPTPKLMGTGIGNIVYGTEGFVAFGNEDAAGGVAAFDNNGKLMKTFKGRSSHFYNFIDAVRSRKQSDLHAPVEEIHLSSALCHLANISYRTGEQKAFPTVWNSIGKQIDLAEAFGRFEQHLEDNKVALKESMLQLGPQLEFNPKSERFTSDAKANALLTREYRTPFVIPEQV